MPVLQKSDLTYLGCFRVPGWDGSGAAPDQSNPSAMAGRRVGGKNRLFLTQNFYAGVGPWSVYEIEDPGTYDTHYASAPVATLVRNWGISGGAPYDMWHGIYGMTYDAGGTLIQNGGNRLANTPQGMSCKVVGGDTYLYMSYGAAYGTPPLPLPWTTVIARLTTEGTGGPLTETGLATDAAGPFRFSAGVFPYGGAESTGPRRVGYFVDLPDGTLGIVNGKLSLQQDFINKGPSLFGGLAPLTLSTPQGFGSARGGDPNYRTTDLIAGDDYLAHYPVEGHLSADGTLNGGTPNWSMRRPPHIGGTYTNYTYEGGACTSKAGTPDVCVMEEIDPNAYGGIGCWTSMDGMGGAEFVHGSKFGFLCAVSVSVGRTWYRTRVDLSSKPFGTGTDVLYARNVEEAWSATFPGDPAAAPLKDSAVRFDVTPANYSNVVADLVTVTYVNDGPSQPLTISVSGKAITVHLATNGSSVITSTGNDVVAAVNASGPASALVTASLYTDGIFTNDGTGVVELFTQDYAKVVVPTAHRLDLAGGPAWSPHENENSGAQITGPVTTKMEPAIVIYDPADLRQTPDYSPDPTEWIWLHDVDADIPVDHTINCPMAGMWFDSVERKLYVQMTNADKTTQGSSTPLPVILVFAVAGTSDEVVPPAAGWMGSFPTVPVPEY